MKRVSFFIALVFFFSIKLQGQNIEGKIIFAHDTIDVTFKIPLIFPSQKIDFYRLQNKVKYFDSTGKKITLWPEDAKEIQFKYNNHNIRMLSRKNLIEFSADTAIFLRLVVDGELKLFYYYALAILGTNSTSTGMVNMSSSARDELFIMQKGNDELFDTGRFTFRKDMMEYFSDCPALSKLIETKEFLKDDVAEIVNYYNSKCNKE